MNFRLYVVRQCESDFSTQVMIPHCTFFCLVLSCSCIHLDTTTSLPGYRYEMINLLASPPSVFISQLLQGSLRSSAFYETVRLQYLYIDLMTSNVQPFLCFFVIFLVLLCLLIGATLQLTPLQLEALLTDGNTSRFWLVGSVDISWISYS